MELKKEELLSINGGLSISGTLLAGLEKLASTIFDLGKSLGSSIRQIGAGKLCPL